MLDPTIPSDAYLDSSRSTDKKLAAIEQDPSSRIWVENWNWIEKDQKYKDEPYKRPTCR